MMHLESEFMGSFVMLTCTCDYILYRFHFQNPTATCVRAVGHLRSCLEQHFSNTDTRHFHSDNNIYPFKHQLTINSGVLKAKLGPQNQF